MISTIAGVGTAGFSGDGGPATAAYMDRPSGLALDNVGNLYFGDHKSRIRKINTAGIISTVAGGGSTTGDGIPATAAILSSFAYYVCVDASGNLYIADNYRVRKVNTAGVISTYAGTGVSGFSGDGGPATAARFNTIGGDLRMDNAGNLYICDNNNRRVRKVDPSGIISTLAGNGTAGISPASYYGPATAAGIDPRGVFADNFGGIFIADIAGHCLRKVDGSGTMLTVGGNGTSGYSGDGGTATAAMIDGGGGIYIDQFNSLYHADANMQVIRKITDTNNAPHFIGGAIQNMSVCKNIVSKSIDTLLAVIDSDAGQPLTWAISIAPKHGVVVAAFTGIANTDTIIPSGLNYIPTTGYSGADSFTITITDGVLLDETKIKVNVSASFCSSTGVINAQYSNNTINVFPNPASQEITISASQNIDQISICNLVGQVLFQHSYDGQTVVVANIATLPHGIYLLKINNSEVRRVTKQ